MQYIDRVEETKQILEFYNNLSESSIMLVFSLTGVGKSTISQRITEMIKEDSQNVLVLRIFTSKINQNDNTSKGDFLREIFKNLSRTEFEDKHLSCRYYITHLKNASHRKYILGKLLSDISSQSLVKGRFLKVLGRLALNWVLKLEEFDYESLLGNSSLALQIMNGYIDYVLCHKRAIINIDNIQNIDDISNNYIAEWITRHKERKHFFLFEYTTPKEKDGHILRFRDDLVQLGIPVHLFGVKDMDPYHAIEAARNNASGICDIEKLEVPIEAEKFYAQSDGNIRSLEDFIRQYNRGSRHVVSFSPLSDTFSSLTRDECTTFCAICQNDSKVHYYELKYILGKYAFPLEKVLDALEKKYDLIERNDDYICIKHASIYDEWKTTDNTNIHMSNILAYEALSKHYEQILHLPGHAGNTRGFIYLLKLYSAYEPDKIYDILNNFDDLIQDFVTPEQLSEYIKSIDRELCQHAHEFVAFYYRLIDMCLEMKMFTLAEDLLERIKDYSEINKYIFYRCNILHQSERHTENINFIKDAMGYVENKTLIMYLKLFLLVAFRSINDTDNVRRTDTEIQMDLERHHNSTFHAFYLRLSELRKDRLEAIADVQQSIEIFSSLKLDIQEAKSRVELSFLYAVTGCIAESFDQMDKAEKTMLKRMAHKHIFLNNKAALYMLLGHCGSEIWAMLDNAELVALTLFDKLVVYNNKLAFQIENNDSQGARLEKNKIMRIIEGEKDKHLLALVYYNLYVYYSRVEEMQKAEQCLAKCHTFRFHCKSINARLGYLNTNAEANILLSKPWHVCFLDFWNIDYIDQISF